ncbi:MAG: serine/threonine protein kinase, partial [Candidatus Hydrogenedentes bacterium]|nr:serine/threonine protein kinase [Candidatus Hydrogenedentota bacterium]
MADVIDQLQPGHVIAERYIIKKKLGRGGMGEVFLVTDTKTNRDVALKTLHAKYSTSRQAISRFVREVETVRKLDHPGIVKVLSARKWNDTLFYTMEYIDGKSLRLWLQQKHRLPFPSVVRVLGLVADALNHAHTITIHRDLSPENVMVSRDGSVRLVDFGLAKLDDQFAGLTMVGANLGKAHYMAPEQQTNPAGVDKRADIYPLGVMFFELLTGRAPLPGLKITTLRPDLPPETDAFLEKTMAANPDLRYSNALEFKAALMKIYQAAQQQSPQTGKAAKKAGLLGRIKKFFAG